MLFMRFVLLIFFIKACIVGTHKNIYCWYPFELHRQVDAIQMGTNICLYKVDKKYTGCHLEITELLDGALIGVYVVIRSNKVYFGCLVFVWLCSCSVRDFFMFWTVCSLFY